MAHSNRHTLHGLQGGDDNIGLPVLTSGTGPLMRAKGVPAPEADPELLRAGGIDAKKGGGTRVAVADTGSTGRRASVFTRLAAAFASKAEDQTTGQSTFDLSTATISAPVAGSFQHVGHMGTGPEGRGLSMDMARVELAPRSAQQISALSEGQVAGRSSAGKAPSVRKAPPAVPGAQQPATTTGGSGSGLGYTRSNSATNQGQHYSAPLVHEHPAETASVRPKLSGFPTEAPVRPQKRKLAPAPHSGLATGAGQGTTTATVPVHAQAETVPASHKLQGPQALQSSVATTAANSQDMLHDQRLPAATLAAAGTAMAGPAVPPNEEETPPVTGQLQQRPHAEAPGYDAESHREGIQPLVLLKASTMAVGMPAGMGSIGQPGVKGSPAPLLRDIQAFDRRKLSQGSNPSAPEPVSSHSTSPFPAGAPQGSQLEQNQQIHAAACQPAGVDLMGMLRSKVAARRSSMASSASGTPAATTVPAPRGPVGCGGTRMGGGQPRRDSSEEEGGGSWSD